MTLYDFVKRAIGVPEERAVRPPMAQITIISTQPVKSSTGSRSS